MVEFNLKDPRWFVWAGMVIPGFFIFMRFWEKEWSMFIPLVAAGIGLYFFSENFISKSEVKIVKEEPLGPEQPFIPPNAEKWDYVIDETTGEPIPRKTFRTPPPQYARQPPQYRRMQQ